MYDRILVAVDHSEMSDRAVRAARDLAVLSKGEVWVLHLREREMGAKTGVLRIDETTEDANAQVAAFPRTANRDPSTRLTACPAWPRPAPVPAGTPARHRLRCQRPARAPRPEPWRP